MPSASLERERKGHGTNCDSTEEEFAIETRYPFEWGDICGTSYGPYPFDETRFVRPARRGAYLSSFGSHDRCSESPGQSVKSPIRASPDGIFTCLSKWLRWAVA